MADPNIKSIILPRLQNIPKLRRMVEKRVDLRPNTSTGGGAGPVTPIAIYGTPPKASVGVPYSWKVYTTGGSGTKTFSQTGTLPPGLSFNPATGETSGTPTSAGTFSGVVTSVTDTSGSASLSSQSIIVAATAGIVAGIDSITVGLAASVPANSYISKISAVTGGGVLNQGLSGRDLQNGVRVPTRGSPPFRDLFTSLMFGANKRDSALLMGGTNDIRFDQSATYSVSEFKNDYREIMNGLRSGYYGDLGYAANGIFILSLPWVYSLTAIPQMLANAPSYLQATREVAEEYGAVYVDTYTYMQNHGGDALMDGGDTTYIHPNDAGHQAIFDAYQTTAQVVNTHNVLIGLAATSPSAGTVNFTLTPSGEPPVTYTVEAGPTINFTFPNTQTSASLTGSLTGLSPDWYQVRARANYSDGKSSPWVFLDRPIAVQSATPVWDSFISVGAVAESAAGDLVLTEPPGTRKGDLVIVAISARSTVLPTLTPGLNLVAPAQTSGNTSTTAASSIGSGLMAYYIRGDDPPSLTLPRTGGDVALGRLVTYRGWGGVPTLDVGSSNTIAAASTTVTTPGVTTTAATELLVAAALACNNIAVSAITAATDPNSVTGAVDATSTPAVGIWKQRFMSITATGADCGLAIADAIKATAGSTGTFQYTDGAAQRSEMAVGAFKLA